MRDAEYLLVCSHEYAAMFKCPSLRRNNLLSCLSGSLSRGLFPPRSSCLITQLRRDLRLTPSDVILRLPASPSSLRKSEERSGCALGAAEAGGSSADPGAALIKGYGLQVSQRRKEIMEREREETSAGLHRCYPARFLLANYWRQSQ